MINPYRNTSCCFPITSTTGCPIRLSGECVYYSGLAIPLPGINNGDNFNVVVNKLVTYINGFPSSITASNGLTKTVGNDIQLGQSIGQSGDPATLLSNREIPVSTFTVSFNGVTQSSVIGGGTFTITDIPTSTSKVLNYNSATSTLIAGPVYSQVSNYTGYTTGIKLILTGCTGITCYGDSFTGGFAAENPTLIYPRQLSALYGLTLTNSGTNSGGWYTTMRSIFLRNFLTSNRVDFVTIFTGLIDIISNTSSFLNKVKIDGLVRTAIANLFTVSATPFSDPSVTKVGFSNSSVACQSRATVLGGSVVSASAINSTLTFSFTGTDLVIGTFSTIPGTLIGPFYLVIDGVNGSGSTNWRYYSGSQIFCAAGQYTLANETGLTIYPNCIVIRGLVAGAHTCVITTDSNTATYLDYFAVLDIPANVKPVVIGSIPHADENVNLNYSVPYNQFINKDVDTINDVIRKVCSDFYDYPLSLVNINKYYFPYTMVRRPDNLHPKTIGHNAFTAAFVDGVNVKRIEDMSAEPHSTFLAGAPLGQTIHGGLQASENLTLSSTTWPTPKGKILFGTSGYDEANNRLGIGTITPTHPIDCTGTIGTSSAGYPTNYNARLYAVHGAGVYGLSAVRAQNGTGGGLLALYHTRNADASIATPLIAGDTIGGISFLGVAGNGSISEAATFTGNAEVVNTTNIQGFFRFLTLDASGTSSTKVRISSAGGVFIGSDTHPTASLHIEGGSGLPETASLKLGTGVLLTTPENGAIEFDGVNLYVTIAGVRRTITVI